ncbi:UNVERIFIED_CONTAM: hypothetical protein Sradi_0123800 [Sesamum radiatum]|uniref:Uncharacterized protein n=1 Tax=Sesamum radiatum TaxID=300843 RepID=A0AAW2WJ34_SESRA
MVKKANDAATIMLTSGASGRINALFSLSALRSLWRLIIAFFLILWLPFRGRRRCMGVGAAPESSEKCGGKDEKSSSTTGKVVRVPAAMVPRKSAAAAVDKEVAARGGRWRLRGCSKIMKITGIQAGSFHCLLRPEVTLFLLSHGHR